MTKAPVTCLSYFKAKPNHRNELIAELLKLIAPTRAESGCLLYELLLDEKDPNFLIMSEKFIDKKALDDHEQQPYIKNFVDNYMSLYCDEVTWNVCKEIKP